MARFDYLEEKFREIHDKGWIRSVSNFSSGVGDTFENCLGKVRDDFPYADFDGIEIKTQRFKTDKNITLFGAAPMGNNVAQLDHLRKKYGYFDYDDENMRKLNLEFYASKNVLICNRYFFNLFVDRKKEKIILKIYDLKYQLIDDSSYWDFDDLREKFEFKLKYLAFILAQNVNRNNSEYFKYFRMECLEFTSFDNFLSLIEKNIISVSITTSSIKYGPSKGNMKSSCYFRINRFDLSKLFNIVKIIDYSKDGHY